MISLDLLQRAVSGGAAAPSSDYDLNPEYTAVLPQGRKLRAASVLVPVIARENGLQVVLTKRSPHLKHHPGQVAFPGGKAEAGETTEQTALREAFEEIALPPDTVTILGALDTHETVTNFAITPVIGLVGDFIPVPERGEVEEVFEVPLDFLMDPANISIQGRNWQGFARRYYTVPYGPYYIWGATARMIKALADRVSQCR